MSGTAGARGTLEYAVLELDDTLRISIAAAPDEDPSDTTRSYFEEANRPYQRRVAAVLPSLDSLLQGCARRLKLIPLESAQASQRRFLKPSSGGDMRLEVTLTVASEVPLSAEDERWLEEQVEALVRAAPSA